MRRIQVRPCACAMALALALALAGISGARAQRAGTDEAVLRGSQVTEEALIDALSLEPAQKTRGFRPLSRPSAGPGPAAKGKASLLMTFATGSSELALETRETLDVVARALRSESLASSSFTIEGHADQRGDAESNRALSQDRADAVAAYLVHQHHIARERLNPVGKGANEPLNRERMDAPENRRVTIVTRRP